MIVIGFLRVERTTLSIFQRNANGIRQVKIKLLQPLNPLLLFFYFILFYFFLSQRSFDFAKPRNVDKCYPPNDTNDSPIITYGDRVSLIPTHYFQRKHINPGFTKIEVRRG